MPALSRNTFHQFITSGDLKSLFIEMGWNNDTTRYSATIEDKPYVLQAIAQKEGFKVIVCKGHVIPEYRLRRLIDTQITRQAFAHLIIFLDDQNNQRWMIQHRLPDKPYRIIELEWYAGQDVESLYQRARGLFFDLNEQGQITIVDVIQRVTGGMGTNSEKVTKRFYDRFTKEHNSFKQRIHQISDDQDLDWYASLMLNRLMFCYFIQKKRFLDDNPHYLLQKLQQSLERKQSESFYSFYRNFLLVLFHDGLGGRQSREQVTSDLGRVPYLNGGLFEVHDIEKKYPEIAIDDTAFEQIFGFFDEYEWHLDSSADASGREINPDVIGYIFEKYINDRAKMGAYYTKEDITEYISKNCIIPFLFDATIKQTQTSDIWNDAWHMLAHSGDTYIYPAVKHGCNLELPENISVGISNVSARTEWNKAAPASHGNPTEIWREVVARRERYTTLSTLIRNGEIRTINDFITHNLDIRQFCQDAIASSTNPHLIHTVYTVLNRMTILDPTCGSGAFLFAALNILEPLYAESLNRMHVFVDELPQTRDVFGSILHDLHGDGHPNEQYYIYKNIILNNLYGVDIMKEATEVAKLRLFLKLVACVDADKRKPNLGIEPLPDIDFNIRSGNSLVGFATKQQLEEALVTTIDGILVKSELEALSSRIAQDFDEYKELQLHSSNYELIHRTKKGLQSGLFQINDKLNQLLHQRQSGTPYAQWLSSHTPFHWFAEFYEIIEGNGGFDVIIGNPPYVVYVNKKWDYKVSNQYFTFTCGNLYAFCYERSIELSADSSRIGIILPNSCISAQKMEPLQKLIRNNMYWISNFAWRPSKLFEGADMLLAIVLSTKCSLEQTKSQEALKYKFVTGYSKWNKDYRAFLFESLVYFDHSGFPGISGSIAKIPSKNFMTIFNKMKRHSASVTLNDYFGSRQTNHVFYYFRAVQYWVKILTEKPVSLENNIPVETTEMKEFYCQDEYTKLILSAIMSSNLYFVYYIVWSSCQVINSRDLQMPINLKAISSHDKDILCEISSKLQADYVSNSHILVREYSSKGRVFTMKKQHYYIKKSKPLIDQIDLVLANVYGFTEEELDYIINYDIKFRMGGAEEDESDE
jgi:hypothetical protein